MSTLNERVSSLIKQIKPKLSDDQEISERWLEDQINNIRAAIARQIYNDHGDLKSFYQTIPITGTLLDPETVSEGIVSINIQVCNVPILMEGVGNADIIGLAGPLIGGNGGMRHLPTRVSFEQFRFHNAHSFGTDHPVFAYQGGRLFIKTDLPTMFVGNLIAIAKDPRLVSGFNRDISEYPLSSEYKTELLVKQHIIGSLNIPFDPVQDDFDATQPSAMSTVGQQQQKQ